MTLSSIQPISNFVQHVALDFNSEFKTDFDQKFKNKTLTPRETFFKGITKNLVPKGFPERPIEEKINENFSPFFLEEFFNFLNLFPDDVYGSFESETSSNYLFMNFTMPEKKISYNAKELAFFERLLEAKIALEQKTYEGLLETLKEVSGEIKDSEGCGGEAESKSNLEFQISRLDKFLKDLQKNLFRVRNQTFGKTVVNGAQTLIHPYRLLATSVTTKTIGQKPR